MEVTMLLETAVVLGRSAVAVVSRAASSRLAGRSMWAASMVASCSAWRCARVALTVASCAA
jgi:hypothetical protein